MEPAFQFSTQLAAEVRLTRELGITHKFQDIVLEPSRGLGKPQLTYRFEVQNLVMMFKGKRKERAKLKGKKKKCKKFKIMN